MAKILVTGGAGYIGSHACKALRDAGYEPVTFDNLSTGWAEAVKFGPLVQGDLTDRAAIDAAFADHQPKGVMHFAAFAQVGESVINPDATGKKRMWGWRYVGFAPFNSCPTDI